MISIKSCYHPIDAAILWCDLADYEEEILRVDLSHPGSLLKHFPQWPSLHKYAEYIYDAIVCGELPATYLGRPISSENQAHRLYWSIRRADLLVWFLRTFPDERPAFLFPQSVDHSSCIRLDTYLAQQAELEVAQRTIERMQQTYSTTTEELAALTALNNELSARLESRGISSEVTEDTHDLLVGAVLEVTLGKSKSGQVLSIYPSQAALVAAITLRFPGVSGLRKHTIDRRFAEARRRLAQALQG
ncbi:hypothetical protein C206_08764 [Pseudomonas putida TRO1]|uniref:Uncharacterized protein n=3 Tax=Pseudomonas TaxID=286 RepID=A0AAP7FLQ6_9PSED|nr:MULTISPECIES: hypothetical protein [Pseudomonas]ELM3787247.1 hypothetical protein [Pseudomonas aeruginosa]ELM3812685.1 hypothetical protein [Pseudomonas aeruginosa]ELS0924772.1 hypothetical protein [Pseudomonas putida]ENY78062.1 hypothetical protein C206_08764 [Pseudomonas putida TRO1]OAH47900.1 hypothetical protein AYJ70_05810 [Pseudomonas monteilii]